MQQMPNTKRWIVFTFFLSFLILTPMSHVSGSNLEEDLIKESKGNKKDIILLDKQDSEPKQNKCFAWCKKASKKVATFVVSTSFDFGIVALKVFTNDIKNDTSLMSKKGFQNLVFGAEIGTELLEEIVTSIKKVRDTPEEQKADETLTQLSNFMGVTFKKIETLTKNEETKNKVQSTLDFINEILKVAKNIHAQVSKNKKESKATDFSYIVSEVYAVAKHTYKYVRLLKGYEESIKHSNEGAKVRKMGEQRWKNVKKAEQQLVQMKDQILPDIFGKKQWTLAKSEARELTKKVQKQGDVKASDIPNKNMVFQEQDLNENNNN